MRSFYKGICGIFFTFGIDNEDSFASLDGWVKEARENAHEEAVLFLVGAKSDLEFYRKVTTEQAHAYLKEVGAVFYIETSAKTGNNIDLVRTGLLSSSTAPPS
jgi:GTPase SAR1 family protein